MTQFSRTIQEISLFSSFGTSAGPKREVLDVIKRKFLIVFTEFLDYREEFHQKVLLVEKMIYRMELTNDQMYEETNNFYLSSSIDNGMWIIKLKDLLAA